MNDERLLPPIASPYGAGESRAQIPALIEELEFSISVHLTFETAFRSAYIELIGDIRQLVFTLFIGELVCITVFLMRIGSLLQLFSLWGSLALCLVGYCFFRVSIYTCWKLIFSPRFEVEIQPDGIHTYYLDSDLYYLDRKLFFPWRKLVWIIYFDGNVLIASSSTGSGSLFPQSCLIPREAFDSPTQAQTFAISLRQLWHNKRAAQTVTRSVESERDDAAGASA